jgi:hypothetical protein
MSRFLFLGFTFRYVLALEPDALEQAKAPQAVYCDAGALAVQASRCGTMHVQDGRNVSLIFQLARKKNIVRQDYGSFALTHGPNPNGGVLKVLPRRTMAS